ncbi:BON domain-containing protein [Micromonospora endolithica]|uniref:BON domain-containing protein n=1 Tax=Micromonospora endolithica TaxID=230091 RepID=A0A3A9ZHA7_9ACTN|nr:BON domain-containing protein [Micromonospora endolithica]RKN47663.1 BON domain-containing protein [Micromonospora endolithica]TWJ21333.1 BON domain-containing protein [Micromonospora endolithica]
MTYPWFFPDDLPSLFPSTPVSEDTRLACRLLEQMQREPLLRHERICIEVQDRVVILEGSVSSAGVRAHAHALVWGRAEVRDVSNRLRLRDE